MTQRQLPVSLPKRSEVQAGVPRLLNAYSNRWSGPMPAIVVMAGTGSVNVNVMVDAANSPDVLRVFRDRPAGNTFTSVALYDTLSPEERAAAIEAAPADRGCRVICEWPPMPAGGGGKGGVDAAKMRTEIRDELRQEFAGELAKLRKDLSDACVAEIASRVKDATNHGPGADAPPAEKPSKK